MFALTTPFESGPQAEIAQGRAIIAAARRAGVPHLMFSSVAGAEQHTGVPHFDSKAAAEADLAASGLPYTILGPTYFFDNALGGAEAIRAGLLELPLPTDRPLQQLARLDHGALAAHILLDPAPHVGRRIEVASDAPTPAQMATALSRALGREMVHHRVRQCGSPRAPRGDPRAPAVPPDVRSGPGAGGGGSVMITRVVPRPPVRFRPRACLSRTRFKVSRVLPAAGRP